MYNNYDNIEWLLSKTKVKQKILVLHGGGGSGKDMKNLDLIVSLSSMYDFVFADSPVANGVWYEDPPGGKGNPTTDPNWANVSIQYLDGLIATHGTFVGLIGYSQGSAMAAVYLSHNPKFSKVLLFNGYLPTTHNGLIDKIDSAAPFEINALIFSGAKDTLISKTMTDALAAKFSNRTRIHSNFAGHNLPTYQDPTFAQVRKFLL